MALFYPLITIITVSFNVEEEIETTIQNVLGLNYPHLEFIIIDGGSTDRTIDIIKKYESNLKYWISEPDKGIYDAMNKGWTMAANESYILYLGAGDKVLCLPKPDSFLNSDVIYGNVEIGGRGLFRSKHNIMLKLGNTIHHQAQLVKKSFHPEAPFSLRYEVYSDFNFNQQLFLRGARFKKDPTFISFALEDGISSKFDKTEPLNIVKTNFGYLFYLIASLYYLYKNGKL